MLPSLTTAAATPLRHPIFPGVLLLCAAGSLALLSGARAGQSVLAAAVAALAVAGFCAWRARNLADDWGYALGLTSLAVLPALAGAGGWAPWLMPPVMATLLPLIANPLVMVVSGVLGGLCLLGAAVAGATGVPWIGVGLGVMHLALLTLHAWSRRAALRERFDIEFLVRAMGLHGSIRLDFGAVRAETEVGRRLKDVQERMGALLRQVHGSAQQVQEHANALRVGGEQLRERTARSAEGLRDAAMTLEQITAIVQASADAAAQARTMTVAASEQARDGAQAFSQVAARMEDINAAARRITDVVGVIDSIAFQTNILALNAAVEAARAGEHGRGFAVVAAEVRSLALRASKAAGEVKGLIETALATTRAGSDLVDTADGRIKAMVESVLRVGEVFAELSADTQQHAGSIDAVTRAVMELDQLTRLNVALVDTTQNVASSLQDHGSQLEQHLGAFRMGVSDAGAAGLRTAETAASSPAASLPPPAAARAPAPRAVAAPTADAPASSEAVEFF